jgi:hypothetical protein
MLLDLLHQARDYNLIDSITGLLLHDRGYFLQVIEGPEEALADLLERLRQDSRHRNFQVFEDSLSQSRLFPNWSMGWAHLSDPALAFLPGMIIKSEQENRLHFLADQVCSFADQFIHELPH